MTRERRLVFGEVADVYDRVRPTYPDALFDHIVAASTMTTGDRVLEIGAGTGKATRSFLARGAVVTAIEPSPAMAEIARRNCPDATVVEAAFEEAVIDDGAYAVVAAAQSWHWVRPDTGPERAADALRAGGHIALFWNWPLPHPLDDGFQEAYARARPPQMPPPEEEPSILREQSVDATTQQLPASRRFERPTQLQFEWRRRYDTESYLALLTTHSDHRLMAPDHLARVLDGIGQVIDDAGGSFEIPYCSTLLMAARL